MSAQVRLKAVDRKKAILEAALPLFAQRGFQGTTTRDLAQAAGMSEALLYRYYPSKESLLEEMKGSFCRGGEAHLEMFASQPPSTAMLVRSVYLMVASICLDLDPEGGAEAKRLVLRSLVEDPTFARTFIESRVGVWKPVLERLHDAAEKSGDLVESPLAKTHKFWFAHHVAVALNLFHLFDPPSVPYEDGLDSLVDQAVWYCLRGMGLTDEALKIHYHPSRFREDLGLRGA